MSDEVMRPRSLDDVEFRLDEIDARLRQLSAEHSGTRFPDQVRDEWNRLNGERDDLKTRAEELRKRKERLRQLAMNPGATESVGDRGVAMVQASSLNPWGARESLATLALSELRSRAVDALGRVDVGEDAKRLAARLCGGSGYRSRAAAEWVLAASDPEYGNAFAKLLRDPVGGHRSFTSGEQQALTRAMALTPDTAGGAMTVPFQLDPSIVLSSDGSVDPFRQTCRRVVISGTDAWKGVSSDGVVANWYPEAGETTDDSPTVASPEIPTHRASAWVPFSMELDQDFTGLRSELGRLFTDAKVQLEAAAFTNGTGTGEPRGIVPALAAGQTVTTGVGAYAADDAYALVEAVPPRFRQGMSVLAPLPIINATRRFTTDTEPEIVPASFDSWLGRPLHETSTLDDTLTTGDTIALAGDFSQAVIVDRVGMLVELNPMVMGANNRPTGQRGLFAFWRVGFDVLVANAIRKLVVG